MSIESAKAFIERMQTDEEFAKKISGCKDAETRMAAAKAEGFDFTAEEIKKVSSELSEGELSEDELDNVAGGACFTDKKGWLVMWCGGREVGM